MLIRRIGLTPRLIKHSGYHEIREAWDIEWGSFVKVMGYLPILLSVNYSDQDISGLELDAVIFTGGNDLSSVDDNDLSRSRDEYETMVLKYCLNQKIPIIGVCRGMQFIAHYYGASLEKVEGHVGTRISLELNRDSKFYETMNRLGCVNSFHNYGILSVSDQWTVLARSADGVIKALLHNDEAILTQMWHPEREQPFNKEDICLIKQFLEESWE